ncbi:hypothetical protein BBJ28_00008781 [Nothophytophthora sp. Chile5]|nr:hypothetical protein BBJ28_00008781 [Nothophytophthora sp. Chile5]
MEWQFTSGVHFARAHGYAEIPVTCGAKLSEDAFVLWCHKLKEATLYIVRTRLPDPKLKANAAALTCLLLRAALEEAHKFQIKKVVMWDPPSVLSHEDVHNQFEIVVGDRDTSLSCARVFEKRGELDREEKSMTPLPEWLGNEKFCWV